MKSIIWFQGLQGPRDNGLKLFLEKDDMERLYDFEEECMEGYFREQEASMAGAVPAGHISAVPR